MSKMHFNDSFLSLHHVDAEDETQVIALGGKHSYLLRHPDNPNSISFWFVFAVFGIKPKTSCILGKFFTTEILLSNPGFFINSKQTTTKQEPV